MRLLFWRRARRQHIQLTAPVPVPYLLVLPRPPASTTSAAALGCVWLPSCLPPPLLLLATHFHAVARTRVNSLLAVIHSSSSYAAAIRARAFLAVLLSVSTYHQNNAGITMDVPSNLY